MQTKVKKFVRNGKTYTYSYTTMTVRSELYNEMHEELLKMSPNFVARQMCNYFSKPKNARKLIKHIRKINKKI